MKCCAAAEPSVGSAHATRTFTLNTAARIAVATPNTLRIEAPTPLERHRNGGARRQSVNSQRLSCRVDTPFRKVARSQMPDGFGRSRPWLGSRQPFGFRIGPASITGYMKAAARGI